MSVTIRQSHNSLQAIHILFFPQQKRIGPKLPVGDFTSSKLKIKLIEQLTVINTLARSKTAEEKLTPNYAILSPDRGEVSKISKMHLG